MPKLTPQEVIESWFINSDAEKIEPMVARINLILRTRGATLGPKSDTPLRISNTPKKPLGRPRKEKPAPPIIPDPKPSPEQEPAQAVDCRHEAAATE